MTTELKLQVRHILRWPVIAVCSVFIAGCSSGLENLTLPEVDLKKIANTIVIPDSTLTKKGTPLQLYNLVGRGIKSCWFSPTNPRLKKHVFFAVTSRENEKDEAEISIHEQDKKGRRGLVAFRVYFSPLEDRTTIKSDNVKLKPELGKELEADIARYAAGDLECGSGRQAAAAKKSN